MTKRFLRIDARKNIDATKAMAGEDAAPCDFWPYLAGMLQADYEDLAKRHNAMLDALAETAERSDIPFEIDVAPANGGGTVVMGIKTYPNLVSFASEPNLIHGTEHVTAQPPYAIPLAARAALDAALDAVPDSECAPLIDLVERTYGPSPLYDGTASYNLDDESSDLEPLLIAVNRGRPVLDRDDMPATINLKKRFAEMALADMRNGTEKVG